MTTQADREVHDAIKVILSDKEKYSTTLNYVMRYCRAGLHMQGYELSVQCLYILNNISYWRHPRAKRVREILKKFTKNTVC